MKTVTKKNGSLRFGFDGQLKAPQIKAYFSRLNRLPKSPAQTTAQSQSMEENEVEEDEKEYEEEKEDENEDDDCMQQDSRQVQEESQSDSNGEGKSDYDSRIHEAQSDQLRTQIHSMLSPTSHET